MPKAPRAKHQCPHCDCAPFATAQALGAHKWYVHDRQAFQHPTSRPVSAPNTQTLAESRPTPAPPVPIPCATCYAKLPDREKALVTVLVRTGLSIERALQTVRDMAPILQRAGNGTE